MSKISAKHIFIGIMMLVYLSGCASYQLDEAQHSLRSTFAARDFDKTVKLLENYENKGIYKDKDHVLFNLEMGMAQHFNSQYDSSSSHLSEAEEQIEQLYTKSISRGLKSFLLTNDNTLEYNGEDYEDIYLNVFKSLNFIHRDNLEAALVEARRIAFKLSQLEMKYKGIAKALSQSDTLKKTEWKAGEVNVQNSAFGHYLSGLLYAKSGKPDDARIEYDKMQQAFTEQPSIYRFQKPDSEAMERIKDPRSFNLLITGFAGRAPIKRQNDVRTYLPQEDLYLKFSLPSLHLYPSRVNKVQAVINDTLKVPVYLMEEMDIVAKEVYKVKEPIIYSRAFARSLVKAIGTNSISRAIEKENEDLGVLANIFGKIGQEITEKADLRSWQTMPGKAYANVVKLEPGDHSVRMEYIDEQGRILYASENRIHIPSAGALELVETLYWN